jgi:hypothetical protein
LFTKYRIAKNLEKGIAEPKIELNEEVNFVLYESLKEIIESKKYQYEYTRAC